jgi:lipopolysaccharide biosynthesis protein
MKRLAVYAHYDADCEVKRYTTFYLEKLAEICDRVDFVSTAGLGEAELDKARAHCAHAINRPNVGFDFGMWKHALSEVDLADWDEVVVTNSSVFGPLSPLRRMFDDMTATPWDFWGATDNYEIGWHLQSYFLVFRRPVLRSDAFASFWDTVLPYKSKDQVIRSYELGLSTFLLEAGFRGAAYVPCSALFPPWPIDLLIKYKRRNPTTYHPIRLMRRGMPFIKAELLRDNPAKLALGPVYRELERTDYDSALIEFSAARESEPRSRLARIFGRTDWRPPG